MAVCDRCKTTPVSWKMGNDGVYIGDQLAVPFKRSDIHNALKTFLTANGYTGVAGANIDNAPIINACAACWNALASEWGAAENNSPDTYRPARAKTTAAGVHLQVEDIAFHKNTAVPAAPTPQLEPIVSCTVHEVIHFWSAASVGVQKYSRQAGVDWDEALCDFFAYPTFKNLFKINSKLKNYVGPYGTNAKCYDVALTTWEQNINVPRNSNEFLKDANKRNSLPGPLKAYFEKQAAPVAGPGGGLKMPALPGGGPPPPGGLGAPPPPNPLSVGGLPPPGPPVVGGPPAPGPPAPGGPAAAAAPKKYGTESLPIYKTTLFSCLATWFFQGPLTTVDGWTFVTLIQNADSVFQLKSRVFPAFGEVATPI